MQLNQIASGSGSSPREGANPVIKYLYFFLNQVVCREEGQDLTEYALTFVVVSLGCVTTMGFLASGVNTVFSSVGDLLAGTIT